MKPDYSMLLRKYLVSEYRVINLSKFSQHVHRIETWIKRTTVYFENSIFFVSNRSKPETK